MSTTDKVAATWSQWIDVAMVALFIGYFWWRGDSPATARDVLGCALLVYFQIGRRT